MSAPRPLIFRVMDAVAGDASLTGRDRLVLLYVVKYADRDGAGCIVSNDTLARALCVDPATVTRAIARLVKRGLIQRKRRRWTSAVTTVVVPQESAPVPDIDTQESAPVPDIDTQESAPPQPRKRTSATKKAHQCARTGLSTDLATDSSSSSEADAVPFEEIRSYWNAHVLHRPMVSIEGQRQEAVRACWQKYSRVGVFGIIDRVAASPLLTGKVQGTKLHGKGIGCNWPWKPENAAGILEGEYDGEFRRSAAAGSSTETPTEDGEWCASTVRRSDRDEHGGGNGSETHPKWAEYEEAACDLPPRTAPPFAEWLRQTTGQEAV
mgnify:FL=1